jgi:hypothetical protein
LKKSLAKEELPVAILLASSLACAAHVSKIAAQTTENEKSEIAKIGKPEVDLIRTFEVAAAHIDPREPTN